MHPCEAGRSRQALSTIHLLVAAVIVMLATGGTTVAADSTMFEGARAVRALEAIAPLRRDRGRLRCWWLRHCRRLQPEREAGGSRRRQESGAAATGHGVRWTGVERTMPLPCLMVMV